MADPGVTQQWLHSSLLLVDERILQAAFGHERSIQVCATPPESMTEYQA
jgi:hypothetical protein